MPPLVYQREPCHLCGAVDRKDAETKCRPDAWCGTDFDKDGYAVAPTAESLQAQYAWMSIHYRLCRGVRRPRLSEDASGPNGRRSLPAVCHRGRLRRDISGAATKRSTSCGKIVTRCTASGTQPTRTRSTQARRRTSSPRSRTGEECEMSDRFIPPYQDLATLVKEGAPVPIRARRRGMGEKWPLAGAKNQQGQAPLEVERG